MKLKDKGVFMPPPKLEKYSQIVSMEIQSWNNIIAAAHWDIHDSKKINGADFYLNEDELGHIHFGGEVHIASDKRIMKILIEKSLARKFIYGTNFLEFTISNKKSAEHALWLFKIHYDFINGVEFAVLKDSIVDYFDKSNK